jgi:hypothetical protein
LRWVKACWRRYAWSCATSGKFGRDDEDEHEQKCGAQHDRAGAGAGASTATRTATPSVLPI